MNRNAIISFIAIIIPIISIAQADKYPTDRLNIPGPLNFGTKSYSLARTTAIHDSTSYNTYTQEYLAVGDTLEDFKNLILISVFTDSANMFDLANTKLNELQEMKLTNNFVSFEKLNNKKTGELMIDFMTSINSEDGQYIEEATRTIYRYQALETKDGKNYIMLFGVSIRAEGDGVEKFLAEHKGKPRVEFTKDVAKFVFPQVTLPKEGN